MALALPQMFCGTFYRMVPRCSEVAINLFAKWVMKPQQFYIVLLGYHGNTGRGRDYTFW